MCVIIDDFQKKVVETTNYKETVLLWSREDQYVLHEILSRFMTKRDYKVFNYAIGFRNYKKFLLT